MPNDDNLRQLVGKKRKKKSTGPTTNPYWTATMSDLKKGNNTQNPTTSRPQELKVVSHTTFQINQPVVTNPEVVPRQLAPQNVPGPNWQLNTQSVTPLRSPLMPTPSIPRLPIPQMHSVPRMRAPLIPNAPITLLKKPLLSKPNIRPQLLNSVITPELKGKSHQMKKLTNFLKLQVNQIKKTEKMPGTTGNTLVTEKGSTSTSMKSQNPSLIETELEKPSPAPQSTPRTSMVIEQPQLNVGQTNILPSQSNPRTSTDLGQPQLNVGANMKSFPDYTTDSSKMPKENWNGPGPFSYPKGIPRSFLVAPRQDMDNAYVQSEPRDWTPNEVYNFGTKNQLSVQTQEQAEPVAQPYSPSDVYEAESLSGDTRDDSESPDKSQSGQKRLSAFHRLGPISQPKKPKLTINLLCNKDQAVREVIDETEEAAQKYTPVHLRKDIMTSLDEIVMKYLVYWPWKKHIRSRRTATLRHSKSVMILEQEQMEAYYEKNNCYSQVTIKGYPKSWNKEDVLDTLLDAVKGKCLIPCFIEFTEQECKFLVLRSRSALVWIHKLGFVIRKDNIELTVAISMVDISLNHLDFIPRIVIRKKVMAACVDDKKLNLSAFTLAPDISHFIYFPLSKITNQTEFIQMKSITWEYLTDLDLSHNNLTTIAGFDLTNTAPKLRRLNLSHNLIDKLISLLCLRELPLTAIWLDGNPLCHDYTDPALYIKVIRMMFPCVIEIDGVKVILKGEFPPSQRNFSPPDAVELVDKFLDIYFPLMESPIDQRYLIQGLYEEEATMSITCDIKIRNSPLSKSFGNIFLRSRNLSQGNMDIVKGASTIATLINKWPKLAHDLFTVTVDVMHHDENSTIFRMGGVLKLLGESLADDEQLVAVVRTFVLRSVNGVEYKIANELVFFGKVPETVAQGAFQKTAVKSMKPLSPKLDSNPDEEHKEEFIKIFMKITTLDRKATIKCLEGKEWHLAHALEHFAKLLRLDDVGSLLENV